MNGGLILLYLKIIFSVLLAVYYFVFLIICRKEKCTVQLLFVNSAVGLAVLFILRLLSPYIGILVPVNIVSVSASSVLGPIGLGAFLLINYIFL